MKNRRFTRLLVSFWLTTTLHACQAELPFEDADTRLKIEQLMMQKKFAEAREELEHAEKTTALPYKTRMDVNSAMIDISEGAFDAASKRLSDLLNAPPTPTDSYAQTPSEDLKWIHYLKGIADMALYKRHNIRDDEKLWAALKHLYLADDLGLPCRAQIGKMLEDNLMRCSDFQPEEDRLATSPAGALPLQDKRKTTVCPHHSVWLKFETLPHTVITPTVIFNALERSLWPDESSRLPFSNARIRIYPSDELNRPLDTPILDYELPLAQTPPASEDYRQIRPELETWTAQSGESPYYIELSTKRNGEAVVELSINASENKADEPTQNQEQKDPQDNPSSEDQEQKDPQDKPSSEDQEQSQKSDSGENENDAPQEKTDQQAAPQGPGEDTAGDQSKPDQATNKNPQASAQALESYERRRLDEALDGQEAGIIEIPTRGTTNREEAEDDMPW